MPEDTKKTPEQTDRRFVPQWVRDSWGRLLIVMIALIVILICLIRPLFYTVTHFSAIDCGSLLGTSVTDENVARQDTQCFLHAHQQCEAATLEILYQGVDSGGRVTFRTANGIGGCTLSVIGYATRCIIPFCNFTPYVDNDCSTVTQQADGLHLGNCGKWPEDFVVPTKPR